MQPQLICRQCVAMSTTGTESFTVLPLILAAVTFAHVLVQGFVKLPLKLPLDPLNYPWTPGPLDPYP